MHPSIKTTGVAHTQRFVEAHVEPCRLLEVGCGKGELAAVLAAAGFDVLGIDIDSDCVQAARARGVEAHRANVLEFEAGPFDAVLFSRCLHHIRDPEAALRRALRNLGSRGWILIEDFGYDLIDRSGARWRYSAAAHRAAGEKGGQDDLQSWAAEHPPDHLQESAALLAAVSATLPDARHFKVPYLYRYRIEELGSGEEARGEALFRWEEKQIDAGRLAAVGMRWVYSQAQTGRRASSERRAR